MTLFISLVIGFAAGCFINYAITSKTGKARNFGLCIGGAIIGGVVIPWLLSLSSPVVAVIGAVAGTALLLLIYFRVTLNSSGSRA